MGSANLNSQLQTGLNNGEDALSQEHALDEKNKETSLNQDGEQTKAGEEQSQELTDALGMLNRTSSLRNISRVNQVEEYNAIEDIRQQCLFYLWTIFFGKSRAKEIADKLGISSTEAFYQNSSGNGWQQGNLVNANRVSGQLQAIPVTMFSITAEREILYVESESTTFSTTGMVKTADGREINFNLDVSMSQSFSQYTKETVENVATFIDPLVIKKDYNPEVEESILECIGKLVPEEMIVLVTMTVPSDITKMTINLKGPIVINAAEKKGCQIILDSDEYQVKFPVYEILSKKKAGE